MHLFFVVKEIGSLDEEDCALVYHHLHVCRLEQDALDRDQYRISTMRMEEFLPTTTSQ